MAASIFSIDESLGVFGFALDNSVDPILRFEGVSSTHTADLTFTALSDQILIDGLGGGLAVRGQAGTNSGELRLQEVSTSGSEYVGFKAPIALALWYKLDTCHLLMELVDIVFRQMVPEYFRLLRAEGEVHCSLMVVQTHI